jgi:hypothetical protein
MKKAILLFAICLVLFECSSEKKTIPVFNLQNTNRPKVLNLSEMISDINVVRLETSDDILLGENAYYLVSRNFIVAIDMDKILLFSSNGNFIKALAKSGKGPDEFFKVDAFDLDGKNDILYINHRGDSKNIISFDLKKGERINRIPTSVDNLISQIAVINDTVLAIMPRMNKEYNLYYLSTSGRIINSIAPPKVKGIGLETVIAKVSNKVFFMPKEYDTLYLLNNITKEPYCFFNIEDRFTFENNEIGSFVYLSVIAPNFMIANKAHARIKMNSDGETFSMNADKVTLYWIDKKDFSVSEISGFRNDYFGINETFNPWQNYLFISNDLAFIKYSSFDLKQLIKKAMDMGKLDNNVKQRISAINEQTNENDNPILVIGKLKL